MAKKILKNNKKTNLILIVFLAFITLVIYSINKSMQDLKSGSSLREEKNVLLSQNNNIKNNRKEELANYWDQELLIAQQIETAINYKTPENTLSILKNLEENLPYNRNKVAVIFYLAEAYCSLGNKEKAAELYQLIRNKFNNGNINLYIFNAPRIYSNYKTYSISAHEESILRQAKLDNSIELLKLLDNYPGLFGFYKNEKFLYSFLGNRNIYLLRHDLSFLNSYEQYWHLAQAENTLTLFLSLLRNQGDIKNITSAELLAKNDLLEKLKSKELTGSQFKFKDSRTIGLLFFYTFTSEDESITIELLDDSKSMIVNGVIINESAANTTY